MKLNLLAIIKFFIPFGGPVGYLKKYGRILKSYGQAWDNGDIEAIINHFADEFIYTDVIAQQGITNKTELREHLVKVFERFPRQKWTTNATFYPHFTPYKFAVSYEYTLAGEGQCYAGTGMEKMTFKGDKLIEDRIHMIFNELDVRQELGFAVSAA